MAKLSKIDTQLKKTAETSNIVDIKPVTIEQPKTASNLSKPVKQPKILTQQPETVKKSTK